MENGARLAALEALQRCRRDGAWSAQAMDAAIRKCLLHFRDGKKIIGVKLVVQKS